MAYLEQRVNNIMRAHEFIFENNKSRFTPQEIQKMADLYRQGNTAVKIGKDFGSSANGIFHLLKKLPDWNEIKLLNRQNTPIRAIKKGLIDPKYTKTIIDRFSNGESAASIAKDFDRSSTNVLYILKKLPNWNEINQNHINNVCHEQGTKGINNSDIAKMANRYASGETYAEISKDFNIKPTSVYHHLKKLPNWVEIQQLNLKSTGRTVYSVKEVSPEDIIKMANLYAGGNTAKSIAKDFNISTDVLTNRLEKLPNWKDI